MLNPSTGFAGLLAQMYAGAKPQFMAQQINPPRMPTTGSTNEGYGPIGEAIGKGASDFVQRAYVDPRIEAEKNKTLMSLDPKAQYEMMTRSYEMYSNLPEEGRAIFDENPNFQATLSKWHTLFPGQAPVTIDASGKPKFVSPAPKTVEELKVKAYNKGTAPEGALFSTETENLGKTGYYKQAGAAEEAQGQYHKVRADLYPSESKAETKLKEAQTAATENKAGFQDPVVARLVAQAAADAARADRQEKTEAARWKRQQDEQAFKEAAAAAKVAADEKKAAEVTKKQELAQSLGAFYKAKAGRENAVSTGVLNRTKALLDDAADLSSLIDTTSHLPESGPTKINLSISMLRDLAHEYEKGLEAGVDPKILQGIRTRAQDIYGHFYYDVGGKPQNALEHPEIGNPKKVKEYMKTFEQQKTTSSLIGNKQYVVPSNIGTLNKLWTKATGYTWQ